MTNVSKQIYRKLTSLIPDLHEIEPFNKVELKDRGYPGIQLMVLDSKPNRIYFILSRYENDNGHLIANPSIEIILKPQRKVANVKTYKDVDYFHSAVVKPEIGEIAISQANRYLFDFLNNLRSWNRSLSEKNFLKRPSAIIDGR